MSIRLEKLDVIIVCMEEIIQGRKLILIVFYKLMKVSDVRAVRF